MSIFSCGFTDNNSQRGIFIRINVNKKIRFIGTNIRARRDICINKMMELMTRISWIEFCEGAGRDSFKHFLGKDS